MGRGMVEGSGAEIGGGANSAGPSVQCEKRQLNACNVARKRSTRWGARPVGTYSGGRKNSWPDGGRTKFNLLVFSAVEGWLDGPRSGRPRVGVKGIGLLGRGGYSSGEDGGD